MDEKISAVLHTAPASQPWYERYIRVFCREVFLDKASDTTERAFWLSKILRPWPYVFQARLLFILYGPLSDDGGRYYYYIYSNMQGTRNVSYQIRSSRHTDQAISQFTIFVKAMELPGIDLDLCWHIILETTLLSPVFCGYTLLVAGFNAARFFLFLCLVTGDPHRYRYMYSTKTCCQTQLNLIVHFVESTVGFVSSFTCIYFICRFYRLATDGNLSNILWS